MPSGKVVGLLVLAVIATVLFYAYFFIISPTFVFKPQLTKPTLAEGEPVGTEHIQWLVNELGAYKLHDSPLSGDKSEIEMYVTTEKKYFSVVTENNVPKATEGRASDPDIRISGSRQVIVQLLASSDMLADTKSMANDGTIQLDILKDMAELVPKGYKALYDELA
jgi:hypothetical protein